MPSWSAIQNTNSAAIEAAQQRHGREASLAQKLAAWKGADDAPGLLAEVEAFQADFPLTAAHQQALYTAFLCGRVPAAQQAGLFAALTREKQRLAGSWAAFNAAKDAAAAANIDPKVVSSRLRELIRAHVLTRAASTYELERDAADPEARALWLSSLSERIGAIDPQASDAAAGLEGALEPARSIYHDADFDRFDKDDKRTLAEGQDRVLLRFLSEHASERTLTGGPFVSVVRRALSGPYGRNSCGEDTRPFGVHRLDPACEDHSHEVAKATIVDEAKAFVARHGKLTPELVRTVVLLIDANNTWTDDERAALSELRKLPATPQAAALLARAVAGKPSPTAGKVDDERAPTAEERVHLQVANGALVHPRFVAHGTDLAMYQAAHAIDGALGRLDDVGLDTAALIGTSFDVVRSPKQGLNAEFVRDRNVIELGESELDGFAVGSDASVVVHELGHLILHRLEPSLMPSKDPTLDQASVHEAFGDALSAFIRGTPEVAPLVARAMGDDAPGLRTLRDLRPWNEKDVDPHGRGRVLAAALFGSVDALIAQGLAPERAYRFGVAVLVTGAGLLGSPRAQDAIVAWRRAAALLARAGDTTAQSYGAAFDAALAKSAALRDVPLVDSSDPPLPTVTGKLTNTKAVEKALSGTCTRVLTLPAGLHLYELTVSDKPRRAWVAADGTLCAFT